MNPAYKIWAGGAFIALSAITACTTSPQTNTNKTEVLNTAITAENPDAILSSRENLQPDTIEATTHNRSTSKIAYIGAWASSPQGCKLIDQGTYDGFAVVTPKHIRTFEEICQITAKPMSQNPETLTALCSAEGQGFQSTMIIEMLNSQSMKLKHEGTSGFELERCNLPR